MPTPHPHRELGRRIMPIAGYIREHDLGDGHLAEVALQGLAEFLGYEIVIVDPDPEQKMEDLGREYLAVLGQLAEDPDPEVRAALPGAVHGLVRMAQTELKEMVEREAEGHRATPDL